MIMNTKFGTKFLVLFPSVLQDVKFPLMLDVYELCTTELQEKMLPIRSKFKEVEDKKLEKQQQKVSQKGVCAWLALDKKKEKYWITVSPSVL